VDFEWLISYLGRAALTFDEPITVMMVILWAIVRGSDVVSGELNRGTMEMILAQPISRTRLYVQHSFLTAAGVTLICLLIWLGMTIGVWTTTINESTFSEIRVPLTSIKVPIALGQPQTEVVRMSSVVDPRLFFPGVVNLFCFGYFWLGLSCCFSSWDQYRWRTLGLVFGIFVAAAITKALSMASTMFHWTRWLTFFTLYEPSVAIEIASTRPNQHWYILRYNAENSVSGLGPGGMDILLILLGSGFFLYGLTIFNRRDIPAPM
jgi:ABC-2 type transport system permease protein